MRVVINPEPLVGPRTGIGHYLGELLRCLGDLLGPDDRLDHFPLELVYPAREATAPPGTLQPPIRRRPSNRALALADRVLRPPARVVRTTLRQLRRAWMWRRFRPGKYDLYHEPNFIPIPTDLPTVTSIHDLSAVRHPEWHPRRRVQEFEHNFHRWLPRSVHFLAISESARQEIIRVLGIPPERISRTYMGVRPHLRPLPSEAIEPVRRRLGLPDEYLLHVGTIEPRKNLLLLMRAYGDLPESLRRRCPLVLAGGWGWHTQAIADHYENVARHLGVVRIGYLPDEDLGAVYGGARALVFPSLYEGFGLPPVEMMACGGAVLASRIGPVEETVGGQAHLIEPEDLAGWRDAMARAIADDDWRDGLRRGAVEKARPFTWERCAADTLGAYRLALRQAGGEAS